MRKNHYVKALFPSREGHFSFRWIRGNTCDKAKGLCISSERYIRELYCRSVAYASIWEPCAGQERARRAEFEYLCLGAYTSVEVVSLGFGDREAPFCESYCRAAERLPPPIEHHLSVGTLRRRVLRLSECLRYIIYIGRADAKAWPSSPVSETIINGL